MLIHVFPRKADVGQLFPRNVTAMLNVAIFKPISALK